MKRIEFVGNTRIGAGAFKRLGRGVLAALMAAGLALPAAPAQASGHGISILAVDAAGFPEVTARIAVSSDGGRPYVGLKAGDLEVTEDGQRVARLEVAPVVDDQEPLAVVVLADMSDDLDPASLAAIRAAGARFFEGLGERGPAALMTFAEKPRLVHPFSGDRGSLIRTLNAQTAGGNTAFHDALFTALEYAAQSGVRRTLVAVLTDGNDTASKATLQDGIALAKQRGIPVYAVGVGPVVNRPGLDQLASSTGGWALHNPNAADLDRAYRSLSENLRVQYQLKYRSPAPKGSKNYRLGIKMGPFFNQTSAGADFAVALTPPVIRGFSLADGAELTEPVALQLDVAAARPVVQVQLHVNGRQVYAGPAAGGIEVRPDALPEGSQKLVATVVDEAGNRATAEINVEVPAGVGLAPAAQAEPAAGWRLEWPQFDPAASLEERVAGVKTAFEGAVAGLQQAVTGARDRAVAAWTGLTDSVTGAGDRAVAAWTGLTGSVTGAVTGAVNTILEHARTLAMAGVLVLSLGVGGMEARKLVAILRRRLAWVACSECATRYRAYEESCPECWLRANVTEHADRTLGALLLDNHLVTEAALQEALRESAERRRPLETVLVEQGAVDQEHLARAMFYYNRSAEMLKRRSELMAQRKPKRWWAGRELTPRYAAMLLALVVGTVSVPNI